MKTACNHHESPKIILESEDVPRVVKKRKLTRTPPLSLPKASSYSGRRTNRETEMLKMRLRNPEP